jgi:hypothetical protein
MKKLFAFVILLSSLALGQNVSLSGAFKNPDLTGVTGTLSMKIARLASRTLAVRLIR